MTGDLRSSILTTAAVAASVAGLTVIQPLTAAPPLLLAALLMDNRSSEDSDGVTDALQGKLLPADGKSAFVNFLTGPFGLWNALDGTADPELVVPSTALGVASSMPFTAPTPLPAAPSEVPAAVVPTILPPGTVPAPAVTAPVFNFDLPSLQIGDTTLVPTLPSNWNVPGRPVVTSYEYNLGSYAAASLLNPFAITNSVAAYLERTLTGAVVPVNPDGTVGCPKGLSTCDVGGGVISQTTDENGVTHIKFTTSTGRVVEATVETRDGVTYVTYKGSGALPLVRPLRDYGGLLGNELADLLEPALTALVYWGYRDAIGDGNSLLPSVAETIRAALDFIVGVKQGLESLLQPHTSAADTKAALAPSAGDDKLAAAEATTGGDRPTPDSPEPPKPVAISPEDALNHLTDLFKPPTDNTTESPEAPDEDEPVDKGDAVDADTDETPTTDDSDDSAGDPDSDDASDDTDSGNSPKPDRSKRAPDRDKPSKSPKS
jgi:hypothetical protein